jgi:hypothetical protein
MRSAEEEERVYALFVGVARAAKTFTARWLEGRGCGTRPLTLAQTAEGFAALRTRLLATGAAAGEILVVLESPLWMPPPTSVAVVTSGASS